MQVSTKLLTDDFETVILRLVASECERRTPTTSSKHLSKGAKMVVMKVKHIAKNHDKEASRLTSSHAETTVKESAQHPRKVKRS
jgi:hypothetical protein